MIAKIEPGLPGTGPIPVHLHTGQPTPWSEGFVIRFTPDTRDEWIGNFQTGYGYATKLIDWPQANGIVVIANGATYAVRPNNPGDWTFIDLLGTDCVIANGGDMALISTYTDVLAVLPNGTEAWRRTVAIDGVEIESVDDQMIRGNACFDPPDEWHRFTLHLATGQDA